MDIHEYYDIRTHPVNMQILKILVSITCEYPFIVLFFIHYKFY